MVVGRKWWLALPLVAGCAATPPSPAPEVSRVESPRPVAVAVADAGVDASAPETSAAATDASVPDDAVRVANVTRSSASCARPELSVEVERSTKTECARPASCSASVAIRIVNCTDRTLVPSTLGVRSRGAATEIPPDVARDIAVAAPHLAKNRRVPIVGVGEVPPKTRADGLVVELGAGARWELELFAEDAQTNGLFTSARAETTVIDQAIATEVARVQKARAARVAACRARGGSLEIVGGLAPSEECVFPFPDAGKACHDKADCRGECLFVRAVPVGGGNVRLEGKCSRLDTTFGCNGRIGRTPGRSGVVPADQQPPTMCVD